MPCRWGAAAHFPAQLELALCSLPLGVVYKAQGWLQNPELQESLDEGNEEGCPKGPKARGLVAGGRGDWQS